MIYKSQKTNAQPIIKWAGGKNKMLKHIINYYPINNDIEIFSEPFVGGGAVLLDIVNKFDIPKIIASDSNKDLILMYNTIKSDVNNLIKILSDLENKYLPLDYENRTKLYYKIRNQYNNELINNIADTKHVAHFIFLNKTCFNGLYRVNKQGKFNVPHGKYVMPTICDTNNLLVMSSVIQNVNFKTTDYHDTLNYCNDKTFIYFDPPYRPLTTTASFTAYTSSGFNDNDQIELANVINQLNNRNAKILLSNSDPHNIDINDNFFDDLYKNYNIHRVSSKHVIGRNSNSRHEITELLINNY